MTWIRMTMVMIMQDDNGDDKEVDQDDNGDDEGVDQDDNGDE